MNIEDIWADELLIKGLDNCLIKGLNNYLIMGTTGDYFKLRAPEERYISNLRD